ncbi:MAG: hypothetical protein ABIN89_20725 [Chitinophagaceae bacterium]
MPESTHRHKHKHPVHHDTTHIPPVKHARKRSAALLMAIFIGFLGLTIGALASGMNYSWMIASTTVGAVAGALIGYGVDKSLGKKV